MSEILLQNKNASMQVDTFGAYVNTLHLNGETVFFPKTELNINGSRKLRGGMHVCLPQFGPDAGEHLAQHGFGRTSDWQIAAQSENSLSLTLQAQTPGYEHVEWQLDYSLPDEKEAVATLTVRNRGDQPIRTSPGFHPYFSAEHNCFDFNGHDYDGNKISQTEFVTSPLESNVAFDRLRINIHTENLPVYALWSDRNGSYTCVEPTAEGYGFMHPADDMQFVPANGEKQFQVKIGLKAAA
ncbi:aldose epimerase [Neisseria perflava]|uniref:aldose epimerase family protein n=1 Tax=Neisseria perflava TaxID=33053 RepID=UPI002646C818|nr:aldose epimerase [Neisseria perflava]